MKNHLLILFMALGLFGIACQGHEHAHEEAKPDLEAIKATLQDMENAYAAAQDANDAEAVVAYYADDAHNLPNDAPTTKGKAAILKRVKDQMASDTSNTKTTFEVVEVMASGDLAIEIGKSTTKAADGSVVTTGKYMSVFEKRDGKYVCIRDIWNDDKAAEE